MKPEDIGRRIADRAIRYGNEAGDKFVNAIQSGEYSSKGEARRAFGINEDLPPSPIPLWRRRIEDPLWRRWIEDGLAGASPALPNAATTSYWRNLWNALRGRR